MSYSPSPYKTTATVAVASTTILDKLNERPIGAANNQYSGYWEVHLKNTGAQDLTALAFYSNFNDPLITTDVPHPGVSQDQANAILAKLVAGGTASFRISMSNGGGLKIVGTVGAATTTIQVEILEMDSPQAGLFMDGVDGGGSAVAPPARAVPTYGSVTADNTDAITLSIPATATRVRVENLDVASDVRVAVGQDTAFGTRGDYLNRCSDDGAGAPVLGTGGSYVFEGYAGEDITFYSALAAPVSTTIEY